MTISLMFNLTTDAGTLIADPTGQPWVAVIYAVTGSQAATIVLVIVMIILVSRLLESSALLANYA